MRTPVQKVWGITTALHQDPYFELHHASVKQGGYCSVHRHKKLNAFYVVTGTLKVSVFTNNKAVQEHTLGPGSYLEVPGGSLHMFEAVTDAELIELYLNPVDPNDIERFEYGGVR